MTHSNDEEIKSTTEVETYEEDVDAPITSSSVKTDDEAYQSLLEAQQKELEELKVTVQETKAVQNKTAEMLRQQQLNAIKEKIIEAKESGDVDVLEKAIKAEAALSQQPVVQPEIDPEVLQFKVQNKWLSMDIPERQTWFSAAQYYEQEYLKDHPNQKSDAIKYAHAQIRVAFPKIKSFDPKPIEVDAPMTTSNQPIRSRPPKEGFDRNEVMKTLSQGQKEYLLWKERKEGKEGVESYLKRAHAMNAKKGGK